MNVSFTDHINTSDYYRLDYIEVRVNNIKEFKIQC